jgi:Ca-activated chloride channel family protein
MSLLGIADYFAQPGWWPLLLLLPLLAALFYGLDRRRQRRLRALLGARIAKRTPKPADTGPRWRRRVRILAFGLLLLAALGPRFGFELGNAEQRGIDIVLALDVSRSMLAEDQEPSRLEAAKAQIAALTQSARGDRIALLLFAGDTRLRVPLTRDLASLSALAAVADPYSVDRGGSDLGAALQAAADALPPESAGHESIVLLTDGEDLEGRAREAARRLAERGIVVHCVGFGSPRGAKIPRSDAEGFVKDAAGLEVVTTMDQESLRAIAEASGGSFGSAFEQRDALVQLYDRHLLAMARKTFEDELQESRTLRYFWPLLVAFLILILDLCWTERPRARRSF